MVSRLSQGEWDEVLTPAAPDRLPLSAIGPFTLAPNDTLCVDLAFVFAQDSTGGNLGSVALLKERVAQLRQWYQTQNVQCNGSYGMVTGITERPQAITFIVHPNPANDLISITAPASSSPTFLTLFNARGQLVHQERVSMVDGRTTIGTSDLNDGLYHLVLRTGHTSLHTRVVIAR
ncbi:MAG: T9SS type A sorting domain-containing protein [Flavobacteriales bacterium]|nr:T9SS type A sorting domain-containing protein [Flavobacteriales bacterium]